VFIIIRNFILGLSAPNLLGQIIDNSNRDANSVVFVKERLILMQPPVMFDYQ